ncbi:MAG: CRISPR-associated endonuclease Cas2 [bacterium]
MAKELSPTKQKILLLLLSGLTLGFSYSPKTHFRVIKNFSEVWKKIDKRQLEKEIRFLYSSKLVTLKENPDGTLNMVLSKKGKLKTLNYHFAEMKIQPQSWDKKWRVVIFDIPEKLRKGRDALRDKLKNLGFYELQKSVFVFPFECENEVDFLIEVFNLRKFVRYGILEKIDNDAHLEKIFKLR